MVTEIELEKITGYTTGVNVYIDGETAVYPVGSEKVNDICAEWNAMLDGAHNMPAFGVSLHHETVKQRQKGVWAEFEFDKQYSSNGMPYEKLLVAVNPEWSGFNIIRYSAQRGYDGRCFYYDLVDKNMSSLYNCLVEHNG